MRLRNIPGSDEVIAESDFAVNEPEKNKGKWNDYFGNDNPICIEVGMGKGRFIMDMAAAHPEKNFVGIEMYSSVLIRAIQKAESMEECPENFCFIRMDARNLADVFAPAEVADIYLNFSDPWPKARHADRRLTSHLFLARYEKILAKGGRVEFKTDNQDLFDFSLEEIDVAHWQLLACTRDLHNNAEMVEGNIMTEYEEKFSSAGHPICKLIMQPA